MEGEMGESIEHDFMQKGHTHIYLMCPYNDFPLIFAVKIDPQRKLFH